MKGNYEGKKSPLSKLMEQSMPSQSGYLQASSRSRSPYLLKKKEDEEIGKITGETGTPAY
jgi:hypothetical protein